MVTPESDLWKLVERELGEGLPEWVRDYCCRTGLAGRFVAASDVQGRVDAVRAVILHVRELQGLRTAGLFSPEPETEALTPISTTDERWQLLADLGTRYLEKFGNPPDWRPVLAPVHVSQDHSSETSWPYCSWEELPRVRVDFDPRMSQTDLFELLKGAWPELVDKGWLKETHRLRERTLALLRFVCLECPEDTVWRTRLSLWNERFGGRELPNGQSWAFRHVRIISKDFNRAEERLTGQKHGLAHLYTSREKLERQGRARIERRLAELAELEGMDDEERRRVESERRETRAADRSKAALAREALKERLREEP